MIQVCFSVFCVKVGFSFAVSDIYVMGVTLGQLLQWTFMILSRKYT
jgi:hypothetical protein